jgi:hypothetical protein
LDSTNVAVGYVFYPRPAAALTEKDTIVLADYTHTTGDPMFDDTLRQGPAVQLQQSPLLSPISDEGIRRTLPLMNQSGAARLTPDTARVVCVRTGRRGGPAGIDFGAWQPVHSRLRGTNCATGDILADEQAQASRREERGMILIPCRCSRSKSAIRRHG